MKNFFRKILDGMGVGIGISLIFLLVFSVYAVGFHQTSDIVPGVFEGDYTFNGSVNFSRTNVKGLQGTGGKWGSAVKGINYSSGYVGVGVDNPDHTLHINDSGGVPDMLIESVHRAELGLVSDTDNTSSGPHHWTISSFNYGGLSFLKGANYISDSVLRMERNGDIGIGINNPSAKLDVNGDSIFRGDLDMKGNSMLNAKLDDSFYYGFLSLDSETFRDSEGKIENLTLPSSGNGSCSDGKPQVCVYNDGGSNYEISFDVSEANRRFSNLDMGQILCWPIVPGDTEGFDMGRYENSVENFGTDINGGHDDIQKHNGWSGVPDTGPAVEIETTTTEVGSYNSFGVVCLK